MHFHQNEFYHVYNRGNNRQNIFFNDANYLFFTKKMKQQLCPCSEIICYCLMPNHFHLIIRTNENTVRERKTFGGKPMQEFAYRIGIMLSSYSQAINKQQNTSGSLFQQKTKAKILYGEVEGSRVDYLQNCFGYVHMNPKIAGLVANLNDWPWSSYHDYTGTVKEGFCNKDIFFQSTGLSKADLFQHECDPIEEAIVKKFYC